MQENHRKLQAELDTAYVFKKHVNEIGKKLESYQERLSAERRLIEDEVHSYFCRVKANIDAAEKNVFDKIDSVESREQTKTAEDVARLMKIKQDIKGILSEGNSIIEENTEPETFAQFAATTKIYIRSIEEKLNILEDRSQEIKLSVKCNQDIFDLFSTQDIFGFISAKCPQRIAKSGEANARKFDCVEEFESNGVNPSLEFSSDTESDLVIATWDPHTLKTVTKNGDLNNKITLPGHPEDICIYSKQVAVTLPLIRKINVYQLPDLTACASFQLSGGCSGICRLKNRFVVSFPYESVIKLLSDSGKVLNNSDSFFKFPTFVCAMPSNSIVFVADSQTNTVEAISDDLRSKLFVISHPELQDPGRICINSYQNDSIDESQNFHEPGKAQSIYVCSRDKHCIVQFGPDGKYCGKILSEEDGLHRPRTLSYNPSDRIFTVGGSDGRIQLFQQKT